MPNFILFSHNQLLVIIRMLSMPFPVGIEINLFLSQQKKLTFICRVTVGFEPPLLLGKQRNYEVCPQVKYPAVLSHDSLKDDDTHS